eukprot:SAG31_NODE_19193_length_609_cov_1.756863_1_plen_65_part_10
MFFKNLPPGSTTGTKFSTRVHQRSCVTVGTATLDGAPPEPICGTIQMSPTNKFRSKFNEMYCKWG